MPVKRKKELESARSAPEAAWSPRYAVCMVYVLVLPGLTLLTG